MKKILRTLLLFVFALLALFLMFNPLIHQFTARENLEILNSHWLRQIAGQALETDDLPIGAVLYYEDEVIGEGRHSVLKDGDPTGHAVINALRDAASSMGYENFEQLDRTELKLETTYDPCMMCKGAILNNYIRNV